MESYVLLGWPRRGGWWRTVLSESESGSESIPELASPLTFFGRALVRKVLPQRSPRTQRNKSFPIWYAPGRSAGRLVDGKRKNLSVNSEPSVAKAHPKRRAPADADHSANQWKVMCCLGGHEEEAGGELFCLNRRRGRNRDRNRSPSLLHH